MDSWLKKNVNYSPFLASLCRQISVCPLRTNRKRRFPWKSRGANLFPSVWVSVKYSQTWAETSTTANTTWRGCRLNSTRREKWSKFDLELDALCHLGSDLDPLSGIVRLSFAGKCWRSRCPICAAPCVNCRRGCTVLMVKVRFLNRLICDGLKSSTKA